MFLFNTTLFNMILFRNLKKEAGQKNFGRPTSFHSVKPYFIVGLHLSYTYTFCLFLNFSVVESFALGNCPSPITAAGRDCGCS